MSRKANGATPAPRAGVRCAIYTRKSTEDGLEQEFNSLDAQRESAEAYIKSQQHEGWTCLPDRYDDGGFTGGNMERPALRRLMADIEAGRIDCVVVYKVDRLSRSLLDFAQLMGKFDKHQIAFVSVTQQFNTTNSMGRLMLNALLSFAQFEREIISERTRDKIAATPRKGKWCGGLPPLGYDVVDTKLVLNQTEAEQVRAIFDLYVQHKGLIGVVQELDARGWRTKQWTTKKGTTKGGRPYDKNVLYGMLRNVTYLGKLKYKSEVHEGEHEPIISRDVWNRVQGPLIVQEGESLNVSGQLVDFAGDPILKAGLVAFLVTLLDEATETVINDVDQQDRMAEVAADGSFAMKLNSEDNVIVDLAGVGSGQVEKHVLAMYWLWNDGSQDRSGIQLVRFRVQRLGVQVFPALPW